MRWKYLYFLEKDVFLVGKRFRSSDFVTILAIGDTNLNNQLFQLGSPSDFEKTWWKLWEMCRVIANARTLYVIFYFLNACSKLLNRK